MTGRGADRQRVAATQNAMPAAPGDDRRLQQFSQFLHRRRSVDGTQPNKNERVFGLRQQIRRLINFVHVNRRVAQGVIDFG